MPVLRLPARAWPADAAEHLGTLVSATVHLLPQALGDRWCANRTGAAAEWLAAMDAGGTAAQVALAAMYFYTCREGDQAALWDWLADELINGEAQLPGHRAQICTRHGGGGRCRWHQLLRQVRAPAAQQRAREGLPGQPAGR